MVNNKQKVKREYDEFAQKVSKIESSRRASDIKKEFDDFAIKVGKLESLRQELDVLDVRGFETDASLIRARLRDVNAIPEIERDLRDLRDKIAKQSEKVAPARAGGESRESKKEHNELRKDAEELRRKIGYLKNLIEEKKKVNVKKQLTHD